MLVVIIVLVLVLILLFHVIFYHKYNWPSYVREVNKIPGPKETFYFGSALRYYVCHRQELIDEFQNDFKKLGPTVRYWISGIPFVGITDPDDIQIVLNSRAGLSKGFVYDYIKPWLGEGLLTSGGHKWTKMRKIITPTFHFSVLRTFLDVFNKNTDTMMHLIDRHPDKDNINLYKLVTYCALDNVCETAMGTCINAQINPEDNEYVRALIRIEEIILERILSPMYFTDHMFRLFSIGREQAKVLKILHGATMKIIQEKKNMRDNNLTINRGESIELKSCENVDDEKLMKEKLIEEEHLTKATQGLSEENMYKKKCSFLELLLDKQESENLTDKEIQEEVDVFLFTGHDTTSGTLNWALFELGHHPQIQENVYNELQQVLGNSDRAPTYQDLMEMKYLRRVILETLRLHPIVPFIMRKFESEIQLKNYLVPANTNIGVAIIYAHLNPEIYLNPEEFDPDRFLPEQMDKRHPFAYVPFSGGFRNCIGQRFGMLQMLTIASAILRKYKIKSLNTRKSVKGIPALLLKANKDLTFQITCRQKM